MERFEELPSRDGMRNAIVLLLSLFAQGRVTRARLVASDLRARWDKQLVSEAIAVNRFDTALVIASREDPRIAAQALAEIYGTLDREEVPDLDEQVYLPGEDELNVVHDLLDGWIDVSGAVTSTDRLLTVHRAYCAQLDGWTDPHLICECSVLGAAGSEIFEPERESSLEQVKWVLTSAGFSRTAIAGLKGSAANHYYAGERPPRLSMPHDQIDDHGSRSARYVYLEFMASAGLVHEFAARQQQEQPF